MTLYYAIGTVPLSVALAFVVAYLIFEVGIANSILHGIGLPTQTWLQDPDPIGKKLLTWLGLGWADALPDVFGGPSMALSVMIAFSIWNALGFDVVIYLAGLSAIAPDLKEAATIDGASTWQSIRFVTLPLVSPTTVFLLVTSTIRSFQAFTPIYVLSGGGFRGEAGGPLGSTRVLLLTLVQFRTLGRRAFYG